MSGARRAVISLLSVVLVGLVGGVVYCQFKLRSERSTNESNDADILGVETDFSKVGRGNNLTREPAAAPAALLGAAGITKQYQVTKRLGDLRRETNFDGGPLALAWSRDGAPAVSTGVPLHTSELNGPQTFATMYSEIDSDNDGFGNDINDGWDCGFGMSTTDSDIFPKQIPERHEKVDRGVDVTFPEAVREYSSAAETALKGRVKENKGGRRDVDFIIPTERVLTVSSDALATVPTAHLFTTRTSTSNNTLL